ncbi:MAG: polymer-forming cytoskeletal protein [Verrucomicrobia bacterium]|nr:polymer-forming cytoskeletal protein [Verrucomicrobiota bacterium]
MFKKVIGQDLAEPVRPHVPLADPRAADAAAKPSHSPYAPVSAPSPARPGASATRNVLSSDVDIKGTVKFTNDLVVDGSIEGEIASDGSLTIGENARIKAQIRTTTVAVYGKVIGNIVAAERVDLKSTAEVIGDIKAKTLSIDAGAVFSGKAIIGTPTQSTAPAPSPASKATTPPPAGAVATASAPSRQGTLPGTQA